MTRISDLRRYGVVKSPRPLVRVEERFVDATVDVLVDDWHEMRGPITSGLTPDDWDVIHDEWTAEICDLLDGIADALLDFLGGILLVTSGGEPEISLRLVTRKA